MNGRNAPVSPISLGDNEWSGYPPPPPPMDKDGYAPNNRGQLISPPNSGGSVGLMNGGFPPGPRSAGGPSPPPSIGRSSAGTNLYARSESGRSQREESAEIILGEHYVALKRFLSQSSRDGKPNAPPNKARDKLQRLNSLQFLELSTDVFDELVRRQAFSRRPANAPANSGAAPSFLLPEESFHPKRNQARQKLSSLGPPRFRDLATDVFCELERRFPRFSAGDIPRLGSPASVRAPSRAQTPVNGSMNGFPPRGQSRRRPSEAGSIRSMRSNLGPGMNGGGGGGGPYGPGGGGGGAIPPSPGGPAMGNYDRPLQKQSQSNTIVPNKSTMLEEDDEPLSPDSDNGGEMFGLDRDRDARDRDARDRDARDRDARDREAAMEREDRERDAREREARDRERDAAAERNALQSESDKRLIDDYELQVRDLRDQLESMEDAMRRKDDDMNAALDGERSRATAANLEKKEWSDVRQNLEKQLDEAQNLNDSLREELDRIRDDHAAETRQLRAQMDDLRDSADNNMRSVGGGGGGGGGRGDAELERENDELRQALRDQQQVTEEVRREAQEFLREMRMLSQQSGSTWEKQADLEKTIESLEQEVRDWRNRYARTKTQLRNMRASSMGLTIDQDAGKYVRERGFTTDNGMVKDVHVTKFQISVDELLRRVRIDEAEKAIDSMKAVVVSVRRITKDIDEAPPKDDEVVQQQAKLKSKVSATANSLITAVKNFSMSAGISPVSLIDAAAGHLVAAVVELLRTVKIRATPAGELEDDDDGTMTPVDSTGFFSPRSNGQTTSTTVSSTQDSTLAPPPPFQGLGGNRDSADSSAYSPISSPRESVERYPIKRPMSRGGNVGMNGTNGNSNGNGGGGGGGFLGVNKGLPPAPKSNGFGMRQGPGPGPGPDRRTEDLKIYLDDQTAIMVQTIQSLVGSIRGDAPIDKITGQINEIADIVGNVIAETESSGNGGQMLDRLVTCRQRLLEAGDRGEDLAADGKGPRDREWRMWTQTLPPIAFEIARETKELVKRIDSLVSNGDDDFS